MSANAVSSATRPTVDLRSGKAGAKRWQQWIVGLVILVLVVGTAWWIVRPTGNLRVAFDQRLLGNDPARNEALDLINEALILQDQVRAAYAQYSFLDPSSLPSPLPPFPDPTGLSLPDILTTFAVEADVDVGPLRTAVSINGVKFLEALYSFAGFRDRYIVVRGLGDCELEQAANCRNLDIAVDINSSG